MSCVVRVMDVEYYQSRKQVERFSLELGVHVAVRAICGRAYTVSVNGSERYLHRNSLYDI